MPKALNDRVVNYKYGACIFCLEDTTGDSDCGKLLSDKDKTISVHNYCLLFASGLSQQGEDHEGINGFLIPDIILEYRRGRKLRCFYCSKKPATIGCSWPGCRRCFHFNCGFRREAMFLFFDTFLAYCKDHRPQQKVVITDTDPPTATCPICMDDVDAKVSNHTLKTPCCNNTWFHRTCVQRQALSAGYFFRCAICNNQDQFQQEMKNFGIYIPEHDASWEKEDNAFEDLYWRHDMCDYDPCICPDGRKFNKPSSKWELVLCDLCGSSGCHIACGSLKNANQDWACPMCSAMLSNATEVNCPSALSPQNSLLMGGDSPTRTGQTTRTSMKLMGKHPRTPLSSQTFRKKVTQSLNSTGDLYNCSDFCCATEDFPSYCCSDSSSLEQRYPGVPFDGTQPSTSREGVQESEGCLHKGRKRRLSFCNRENALDYSLNTFEDPMQSKKHCSRKWQSAYLEPYKGSQSSGLIYGPRTTCRMSMRPKKFHLSHHLRISFNNMNKQTTDSSFRNGASACEICNESAMFPCACIKSEPESPTFPARQEACRNGRKALPQASTKSETVTRPVEDEPLSNLAETLSRDATKKAASLNDETSTAGQSALTPDQNVQALAEIHCDILGMAANKNTLIRCNSTETQARMDYQYPFCSSTGLDSDMSIDIPQGPANPCHSVAGAGSTNNLQQMQNAKMKYTDDEDLFYNSAPLFSNGGTMEDDLLKGKDQGKQSPLYDYTTANRHSCVSLAYLEGAKKRKEVSNRQEADEGCHGTEIVLDEKSNIQQVQDAVVQSPMNEEPVCFNDRSSLGKVDSNLWMGSGPFSRDRAFREALAQSLKEIYHQRVDPKRSSSPLTMVHSSNLKADGVRVSSPCGSHADSLTRPVHQSPASVFSQDSPRNLSECSSGNYSFRYVWGGYDDTDHICVTPTLGDSLKEMGTSPLWSEDHSTLHQQTDDAESCSFRTSENTSPAPALDRQWALNLSPDDCSTPCQSDKHRSLSEAGNIKSKVSLPDATPQGLSKNQPLNPDDTNAQPREHGAKARDSNDLDDAHIGIHASDTLPVSRSTQGTLDKKKWKPPKVFKCRSVGMHKRRKAAVATKGVYSCKDKGKSTTLIDVDGTANLPNKAVSTKEHMMEMKDCSNIQNGECPVDVKSTSVPMGYSIRKTGTVKKGKVKGKPSSYPCFGSRKKYTQRKDPAQRVVSKKPRMHKDKSAHLPLMTNLDEDGQPLDPDTCRHLITGMHFRRRPNAVIGQCMFTPTSDTELHDVKRQCQQSSVVNRNGKKMVADGADSKNQSSEVRNVNREGSDIQSTNSPLDRRSSMSLMPCHLNTDKELLDQDRTRNSTGRLLRRKYEKDNIKRMLMPQVSVAIKEDKSEEEAAGSSGKQVFGQDPEKMSSILTDGNLKPYVNYSEETSSSPPSGCKTNNEETAMERRLSVRSSPRTETSPDSGISQSYSCNIEESPPPRKMSPIMMVANYSASFAAAQAEVHSSCLQQNDPQTSLESSPACVMAEDRMTFPEKDRNVRTSAGEGESNCAADVIDEHRNAETFKMDGENGSITESSESAYFMACESRTPESCTRRSHSCSKGKDFRSSTVHINDKEVLLSAINSHQNSPEPTNLVVSIPETPPLRPTRQKPSLTFDANNRNSPLENGFPNSSKPNSCPEKCHASSNEEKSKTNVGKPKRACNSKVCSDLFKAREEQSRSSKKPETESPIRCDSPVCAKSNGYQDNDEYSLPNSSKLNEFIEDLSRQTSDSSVCRSHASETVCEEGQSLSSLPKKPFQELFSLDWLFRPMSRGGRKAKSRDLAELSLDPATSKPRRPSSASSSPLPRSKGNVSTPPKTRVYLSNSPKAESSKEPGGNKSPRLSNVSTAAGSLKKKTTFENVESLSNHLVRPRLRSSRKQEAFVADSALPLPSSVLNGTPPRSTLHTEENKTGVIDNTHPPYSIKAWLLKGTANCKSPENSRGSSSGTPYSGKQGPHKRGLHQMQGSCLTISPKAKVSQEGSSSASPSKAVSSLPSLSSEKAYRTSPRIYRALQPKSRRRHECNNASPSSPQRGTSSPSDSSLPQGNSETNRPRPRSSRRLKV